MIRRLDKDGGVDRDELARLLSDVAAGTCPPEEAARRLRHLPFADLGFARVDHHRSLRQGFPEAVFGPNKTPSQVAAIVVELLAGSDGPVVLTRADAAQLEAATEAAVAKGWGEPDLLVSSEPAPAGRLLAGWRPASARPGRVLVITAGTADLPVAGECRSVLRLLGFRPDELNDCGVAGLHRLLASVEQLMAADAVVVVAGMEGALASVVGGVTSAPVVAVPTSVGYGSSLEGVTALMAMTASCAAGVTVVGIDNGFGAACAVSRLLG